MGRVEERRGRGGRKEGGEEEGEREDDEKGGERSERREEGGGLGKGGRRKEGGMWGRGGRQGVKEQLKRGKEARGRGRETPEGAVGAQVLVNPTVLTIPPPSQTLGPSGSPLFSPFPPFLRVFPAARIPVLQGMQSLTLSKP